MSRKEISFKIDEKGCWNCTSHKVNTNGYAGRGRPINGRKYASLAKDLYVEAYGNLPKGHVLRHLCNNKLCINLSHLKSGTNKDNMSDKIGAGTDPKGERNPQAILTNEQVAYIRSSKKKSRELSNMFGVAMRTIQNARNGSKWQHVAERPKDKIKYNYPEYKTSQSKTRKTNSTENPTEDVKTSESLVSSSEQTAAETPCSCASVLGAHIGNCCKKEVR